jgi:hypothetical protein
MRAAKKTSRRKKRVRCSGTTAATMVKTASKRWGRGGGSTTENAVKGLTQIQNSCTEAHYDERWKARMQEAPNDAESKK